MNFSEFLKRRRTQKNIATAKEHYEELGGEKVLGISLRHFQQIEGGKYPPSETLLAVLFSKSVPSEKRSLVLAYFASVLGDNPLASSLRDFLEQHLSPAIETESKSLWESSKQLMIYSEAQLDFLTADPEALRFHRKLLLFEKTPKKACALSREKLKKLETLDLISVSGDSILPSRSRYRIPHFDNSSPRVVGKATDYIFKQMELYSAREGSPDQELSYAMQMIPTSATGRVLEQMRTFKRWVQSLASTEMGPHMSPLLFVGLVRKIDRREV